jgi:hypothetical protein
MTAGRPDPWTQEQLALLGTMPDEQVAAQTGRTKMAVFLKRPRLGLARCPLTRSGGPHWTEEQLALLGTMPDGQVAAQTGRTKVAVYLKRRKLGITRCPLSDASGPRWTEEELALLGTALGGLTWALCRKRRQWGIPKPCDRRRREHRG